MLMFKDSVSILRGGGGYVLLRGFNRLGTASTCWCHLLFPFTPTSVHTDGLTSFAFILNLPLLSLLLSSQTQGCSLSSVPPVGLRSWMEALYDLWIRHQPFFSLEVCRSRPVASTGGGSIFRTTERKHPGKASLSPHTPLSLKQSIHPPPFTSFTP